MRLGTVRRSRCSFQICLLPKIVPTRALHRFQNGIFGGMNVSR